MSLPSQLRRDIRHAAIALALVIPFAVVATLLTSGSSRLNRIAHHDPVHTMISRLLLADAREHREAIDDSVDRQLLARHIGP